MTPRQKVATILIGLGEDAVAEIMKHLREDEIEKIALAIASMGPVTSEVVDNALAEFEGLLRSGKTVDEGGIEFARDTVERVVGPKRAQKIMGRVTSVSEKSLVPKGIQPERVADLLQKEHPQVIALILSRMDPGISAGTLASLPSELQNDVAYRIATLGDVAPDILQDMEKNLSSELNALVSGGVEVKGADRVAGILNRVGGTLERSVLERLEGEDPDLASRVREKMFTFEDLAGLTDRDLQELFKQVERGDLAVAMKLASDPLKGRILSNLSKRVAADLKGEVGMLGPRRRSEVEEAQIRIVNLAQELNSAGRIRISPEDEQML